MPAGLIPLLHAGVGLADWSADPGVLVPILLPSLVGSALYARGVHVLWSMGPEHHRRGVRLSEVSSFAIGMITLLLALVSPLHEASEQLFSAHMIQHELLMALAAPLLIVGRPAVVMLWAFPKPARMSIGRAVNARRWRGL
jgi:putative membrane protein